MIGVWLRAVVLCSRNYLWKYPMGFGHGGSLDENPEYRGAGCAGRAEMAAWVDAQTDQARLWRRERGLSCWAWNPKILRAAFFRLLLRRRGIRPWAYKNNNSKKKIEKRLKIAGKASPLQAERSAVMCV
jgi:hypothetical protein